jgi:hypothetical protein
MTRQLETESAEQPIMLELALVLSHRLDGQNAQTLFELCLKLMHHSDKQGVLQKKAYKALHILVGRGLIVGDKMDILIDDCVRGLESSVSASKKSRLVLIRSLLDHLTSAPSVLRSFVEQILSEVVLGTKEVAEASRDLSFEILASIAHAFASGMSCSTAHCPVI